MHRIYIWSVISSFLVIVCLFQFSVPIILPEKEYKLPVKTTLYLDREFTDWEVDAITEAADDWSIATNNKVQFNIVKLPAQIETSNAIVVLKVTEDFPKVVLIDKVNQGSTLGLYDSNEFVPYIYLVTDRLNETIYKPVIEHELGHSLGLDHITGENGIGTLMYPSIEEGSYDITDTDLIYFCKIYECDPKHI